MIQQKKYLTFGLLIIGLVLLLSTGCKQDIEKINAIMSTLNLPDMSGKDVEMEVNDSGRLELVFSAPEVKRYLDKIEPYSEFPAGIKVKIFNDVGIHETTITAGYAKYMEEERLWEARDSVVVQQIITNEQLHSDQVFWDEKEKLIYSKVFTRIIQDGDEFIGDKGFEANQDMSFFKLIGSSGDMEVDEDMEEEIEEDESN